MSSDVVSKVSQRVLNSERTYSEAKRDNSGLERIIRVLKKICDVRDARLSRREDTVSIDYFLADCKTKLEELLYTDSSNERSSKSKLTTWANEIETNFFAQDPLMISFNSASENGDTKTPKSSRLTGISMSSKTGSTMLDILKSNGKYKVKTDAPGEERGIGDGFFFLTTIAWGFAVVGMMITIGFLTADFWNAQKNLAIQIERSNPEPKELPAITVCGDIADVPTFSSFPRAGFPGLPLLGISAYSRSNRLTNTTDVQLTYPHTLANFSDSPVEEVIVSADGRFCRNRTQGFDVNRERKSRKSAAGMFGVEDIKSSYCMHCFRIGLKKRELIPITATTSSGVFAPPVRMRVFKSKLFGLCTTRYLQLDSFIRAAFVSEIGRYAEQLEKHGILDFNGFDYSVTSQLLQLGNYRNERIDFFCNVYFFSGFFYPSVSKSDISYEYNSSYPGQWQKTGSGPYYSAFNWGIDDPLINGPNEKVLRTDAFTLGAIELFVESRNTANKSDIVSPTTSMGYLDSTQNSVYTFKAVNMIGRDEYRVKEMSSRKPKLETRLVENFEVGFDFQTFETEQVSTTITMSWPEFVTDVFEFVGLFTGICIFTLIVAPAHSLV